MVPLHVFVLLVRLLSWLDNKQFWDKLKKEEKKEVSVEQMEEWL